MNQEYVKFLIDRVKLKPTNPGLSSNDKQLIECLLCGNKFNAITKGKVNNFKKHGIPGCKGCTHKARHKGGQEYHLDILQQSYEILNLPQPAGKLVYNDKITVKRKECGHEFKVSWYNIKEQHSYCPTCNNMKKAERCNEFNKVRHEEALMNLEGYARYKRLVNSLTEQNYRKYHKDINPHNHARVRAGTDGYQLDHIVSVKNCYAWDIPEELCSHPDNLRMIHWEDNLAKHASSQLDDIPRILLPFMDFSSNVISQELVKTISMSSETMYPLNKKHFLSLYFPDRKLGIFFADFQKVQQQSAISKYYLRSLRAECIANDIKLLVFFEDEWIHKKDIVINMIKQKLGEADKDVVYARNTTFEPIETEKCSKFLSINHLQGASQYHYRFGLLHGGELVSVMTFTAPRSQMSGTIANKYSIELSRFCSNANVVGGASKLLSNAIEVLKREGYEKIFTFSDLRYSSGDLYNILGFDQVSYNRPNYKYVIDGIRKHRWGFRKDLLRERFPDDFDPKQTEYQNMLSLGYDRVWDCGYYKYELLLC